MMSVSKHKWQTILAATLIAGLGTFGLAACSSDDETSSEESTSATSTTSAASSTEAADDADADVALSFENAYVRAMEADSDMTALFGELHNNTDEDITIVDFTSDVAAESFEMHEVVGGVMQEKDGGFSIPANSTLVLEPGSDHFMFMGVSEPVPAGDVVSVTLTLDNGESITFDDIAVRTVGAGDEDYGDMGMESDMDSSMESGMGDS